MRGGIAKISDALRGLEAVVTAQMVGADSDALRRLASRFDRSAERLTSMSKSVRSGLQASAWVGPVSARFRVTWDSEHSVRLAEAALRLTDHAARLRAEADQQEAASAAHSGSLLAVQTPVPEAGGRNISDLSVQDCVDLMEASYDPSKAPDGWEVLDAAELAKLGLSPSDLTSLLGLDAVILTNEHGEYVLSFAGSKHANDWRENVWSGIKSVSFQPMSDNQVIEAMDLARMLAAVVGKDDLLIVGHSLGGREAAAASLATGARAITFNAAGVTAHDIAYASWLSGEGRSTPRALWDSLPIPGIEQHTWGLDDSRITNYFSVTDGLTWAQLLTEGGNAIGEQVAVKDAGFHGSGAFDGKVPQEKGSADA